MEPLSPKMPSSDKVLYVFYYFETTQNKKVTESATVHVPNLVCVQQFCSQFEEEPNINQDCKRCGKKKHTLWDDLVGDLLNYVCEPLPWANKVVAIAHNAKAYDLHFILNRAILKWQPQLIMNGQKVMSMRVEHLHFLDNVSYLPMPLRKLPQAFGLSATK
jgi:hypothetical protein